MVPSLVAGVSLVRSRVRSAIAQLTWQLIQRRNVCRYTHIPRTLGTLQQWGQDISTGAKRACRATIRRGVGTVAGFQLVVPLRRCL